MDCITTRWKARPSHANLPVIHTGGATTLGQLTADTGLPILTSDDRELVLMVHAGGGPHLRIAHTELAYYFEPVHFRTPKGACHKCPHPHA